MTLAHAKFKKERYKTVGTVVYTRYHLYIDIDSTECLSAHPGKSDYLMITETMTKAPKIVSIKW